MHRLETHLCRGPGVLGALCRRTMMQPCAHGRARSSRLAQKLAAFGWLLLGAACLANSVHVYKSEALGGCRSTIQGTPGRRIRLRRRLG